MLLLSFGNECTFGHFIGLSSSDVTVKSQQVVMIKRFDNTLVCYICIYG